MSSKQEDFYNDLLSIVAHDLKTPISAVKGFIELVQQAGPLNEPQTKYSERALLSLERMERLVSDLLEYTRLHSETRFDLSQCDLGALVREAVELSEDKAAKRNIRLNVNLDTESPIVTGDMRLLAQVVNNLIGNAVKYNRDDGEVTITLSNVDDSVRLDVRDTGVGIPEDDLTKVFQRFYRSKNNPGGRIEGSGLGLAIADTIIKKHGGQIWVESVYGEGSTFSFILPRQVRGGAVSYERLEHDAYADAAESSDTVNDDMQEARERHEMDSTSDAI